MIKISDLYNVLSAVVPLYVAMILAYSSVKWWKIFTPEQCSGINRFVALFAVPLLSFHYISSNNPFTMKFRFLAADSVAKLMILAILLVWVKFSRNGSIDWMITLFSLATLPNTLVMGIPLLEAMYGDFSGDLMVQIVVFQCIVWYTLLLFLFEYRAARNLIADAFPDTDTAPSIVSFKVDSDIVSLDGRQPLQMEAKIRCDGKIDVSVRKSTSSVISSRRSHGLASMPSSKALTPRPSNMTSMEVYSVPSSRNPTPRGSSFNHSDFYSILAGGGGGVISSRHSNFAPSDVGGFSSVSPRASNCDDDVSCPRFPLLYPPAAAAAYIYAGAARGQDRPPQYDNQAPYTQALSPICCPNHNPLPPASSELQSPNVATSMTPGSGSRRLGAPVTGHYATCLRAGPMPSKIAAAKGQPVASKAQQDPNKEDANKDLHKFVWSPTSASPISEGAEGGLHFVRGGPDCRAIDGRRPEPNSKGVRMLAMPTTSTGGLPETREHFEEYARDGKRATCHDEGSFPHGIHGPTLSKFGSTSTADLTTKLHHGKPVAMPPTRVMTKLVLLVVWRKLIRNPNTYSSLLGVIWSLISARWGIVMPVIMSKSISILSDAGLGMAMFSLGLFMALQPKIIACGNSVAAFGMAVRFLTGPAVMAATSIAVGIRGVLLHVAIVQAALPQAIVPFVFAKEYNLHPDILSTGVIFGMLIALPITVFYYFLLGL